MIPEFELAWLEAKMHAAAAPDESGAGQSLVTRTGAGDAEPIVAGDGAPGGLRHLLQAAAGIAAAAAVTLVVSLVGVPTGGHRGHNGVVSAPAAGEQPLVRLSARLAPLAPGPGDATLLRRTARVGGDTYTAFSLYRDDGASYVGATLPALRRAVRAGQPGGARLATALTAADEVAALSPDQARGAFLSAIGFRPRQTAWRAAPAQLQEDGEVWTSAIQLLEAGGTLPSVRAAALRLLATVANLTVDRTTDGGKPAIRLRLTGLLPRYTSESARVTVLLDADSGVIKRVQTVPELRGSGTTTIRYELRRVTVAALSRTR